MVQVFQGNFNEFFILLRGQHDYDEFVKVVPTCVQISHLPQRHSPALPVHVLDGGGRGDDDAGHHVRKRHDLQIYGQELGVRG